MNIHERLAALNLKLPTAPKPVASYVPAVRAGGLIYVSGQLPFIDGKVMAVGKVPSAVSIEAGKAAARQCVLNALAIVDAELAGQWWRFRRVVRVGAFICSDDTFTEQPKVANGASDFLGELFGEAGRHARAAVGVNALPLGASVEVELSVQAVLD